LEASQAQLAAVGEKLRRLDEEIAAFKASAVREMEVERQRLKQAAAEEAERALQAARAQLEMATRAARMELKAYAAQQAVELAEEIIRRQLDAAGRRRLVNQFIASLDAKKPQN
jgi:F-type H+-transporting ATPase subunit b